MNLTKKIHRYIEECGVEDMLSEEIITDLAEEYLEEYFGYTGSVVSIYVMSKAISTDEYSYNCRFKQSSYFYETVKAAIHNGKKETDIIENLCRQGLSHYFAQLVWNKFKMEVNYYEIYDKRYVVK